MDKCGKCLTEYDGSAEFLVCDGVCGKAFHSSCMGLNESALKMFRKSKNILWVCDSCNKAPIKLMFDTISSLRLDVDHLKNTITELSNKLSHNTTYNVATDASLHPPISGTQIPSVPNQHERHYHLRKRNRRKAFDSNRSAQDGAAAEVDDNCDDPVLPLHPNSASSEVIDAAPVTVTNTNDIDSSVQPELNSAPTIEVSGVSQDATLSAVPKPVCIFISRLAPSTVADDVARYISNKCNIDLNTGYKCVQLGPNDGSRLVSSFKIYTDVQLAKRLLENSFWPKDAVVHEFVPRKDFLKKRRHRKNQL